MPNNGKPTPGPPAAPPVPGVSDVSDPGELMLSTSELLDRVDAILGRFVAFPSHHARYAATAWVLHTHAIEAFDSTPRLAVLSPEKGSGKTRLLEILELLVSNPTQTSTITAAAIFRLIEKGPTTLLLDESDTYLGPNTAQHHEDLRGLVNAGHRRNNPAYRCVRNGNGQDVVPFQTFAAVALAGIGNLPDTILDRSIIIAMKKRAPNETVEQFRHRRVQPETEALRMFLTVWGTETAELLMDAEPEMPSGITDRPADVWEPLIAIADLAGAPWSDRIRQAAVALNDARSQRDPSLGIQLLADCRRVFDAQPEDRLRSPELRDALIRLEESPWSDLRGRPLDDIGLARYLRPFEVRPSQHRFGTRTGKGYLRSDFADAWERYLGAPETPETPET